MNRLLIYALSIFFVIGGFAQQTSKPKLVVGIVVDQMRYDYLTRFENKYGDRGFNRLIGEGYNCKNHHFNYVPTYTAPGHASVYTGTTPRYHGIISNSWYDKSSKRTVYCTADQNVLSLGTPTVAGKMSPHRMLSTTFADENRLFTQMKGKTIGISIKDRGAILPAGHTANAAYWFTGGKEGKMISSSFYMSELPKWVNNFNDSKTVENYLKPWNTFYDIDDYTESGSDLNDFEGGFYGKETATFPYDIKTLSLNNGDFDILRTTPFGNSIVTDFAIEAIKGENLGKDDFTDVLAISYSSTDYIGHNFGVNSKEIQDTYIRLDKEIERLLDYLDSKVGEGEYTLFLTSDHGAVNVPGYLKSLNIPAGYLKNTETRQKFNMFMTTTFRSADLIENMSNSQVFLNRDKIAELKLNLGEVQEAIVNELMTYDHIDKAFTARAMNNTYFVGGIEKLLQNGFHQKRSGDVIIVNDPSLISYSTTGSTHGSGYNYDTHVPLIYFGKGIKRGSTYDKTEVSDIAPTISGLLNISLPNAATGKPMSEVLSN
ncbi:MAG: alkaline phosphatase family protein [Flavobacteriaceae bacterium]|nr:MAG: alkaline phosphatase family protein [Flavobacteriaceae bacterium]